jgi:hypothetical protein
VNEVERVLIALRDDLVLIWWSECVLIHL